MGVMDAMDAMEEKQKKIDDLAQKILTMSRNTLLVNLRFLDRALSMLQFHATPEITAGTDGKFLLYNGIHILYRYKAEKEAVVHDYLHMIMHCVFRHMYVHTLVDQTCWNLACDVAVEFSIYGLGLNSAKINREVLQEAEFKKLESAGVMMTAEKLYRYFLDQNLTPVRLAELRGAFLSDDHKPWYMTEEAKNKTYGFPQKSSGSNPMKMKVAGVIRVLMPGEDGETVIPVRKGSASSLSQDPDSDSNPDPNPDSDSDVSSLFSPDPDPNPNPDSGASSLALAVNMTEQEWQEISEQMQMDMETFSKLKGDHAGNLMQNLKEVNREKYDYTAFLKKFAVMGEAMKINDDEFDYIFYTYGLKLYKKVPLVEPLEYKDVKRIKEFVIAIDTSGSTSGELVQKFIQKTYNILKSTESFFTKINLHIIQCDAEIQEDVKITNQEEFDEYLKHMRIRGLGGTDFRPVFRRVEELQNSREFTNLKGLIYFTDGYGNFPDKKPPYETAFVFVEDNYNNPDVPPWAIKLILQKDEI